jgi:uncharacterized SAM-binding protein YcdF (DUF218 family)
VTINKLLPMFFSPIVLVCLAVLVGAVLRQRRWSIAGAVFLLACSLPIIADRLFAWSQAEVVPEGVAFGQGPEPEATPAGRGAKQSAEAIVVLSGSMSYVRPYDLPIVEWNNSIDRVFGGIALVREGRASRLIFSGGSWIGQEGLPSEGAVSRQLALEFGLPADRVEVSPQALNTQREAEAIRKMFSSPRPKIILVTSAFHIPRAVITFETEGFNVIAYPVDFRVPVQRLAVRDWIPDPKALEKSDLVIREALGRGYYRLRAMLRTESEPATSDDSVTPEDAP